MIRRHVSTAFAMMVVLCVSAAAAGQEKKDFKATAEYFIAHASASGLAEVAMANLAKSQSTNAAVQKLADRMIEDHASANRELIALANKYLVKIAKEPDKDGQEIIA